MSKSDNMLSDLKFSNPSIGFEIRQSDLKSDRIGFESDAIGFEIGKCDRAWRSLASPLTKQILGAMHGDPNPVTPEPHSVATLTTEAAPLRS